MIFLPAEMRCLEASKRRLSGDTFRQASSGEVKDLRREMHGLCR